MPKTDLYSNIKILRASFLKIAEQYDEAAAYYELHRQIIFLFEIISLWGAPTELVLDSNLFSWFNRATQRALRIEKSLLSED